MPLLIHCNTNVCVCVCIYVYVLLYILVYYNIILYSIFLHYLQTWCGQIQRILLDGPSAPEEQDTSSEPLLLKRYDFLMVHVYRPP